MNCPKCDSNNDDDSLRCSNCAFGFRPEPRPEDRSPGYLGDTGVEALENQIAREFQCPCCSSFGATRRRVSTTGNGLSRLLNWHRVDYLAVTCMFCQTSLLKDAKALNLPRSISAYIETGWAFLRLIVIPISIIFYLAQHW